MVQQMFLLNVFTVPQVHKTLSTDNDLLCCCSTSLCKICAAFKILTALQKKKPFLYVHYKLFHFKQNFEWIIHELLWNNLKFYVTFIKNGKISFKIFMFWNFCLNLWNMFFSEVKTLVKMGNLLAFKES